MICPECGGQLERVPEEDGGGLACTDPECGAAFWDLNVMTDDPITSRPIETLKPV